MAFRALIFDVDGTRAESKHDGRGTVFLTARSPRPASNAAGPPAEATANDCTRAQPFEEAEVVLDFLGGPDRPFPGLVATRRFPP